MLTRLDVCVYVLYLCVISYLIWLVGTSIRDFAFKHNLIKRKDLYKRINKIQLQKDDNNVV